MPDRLDGLRTIADWRAAARRRLPRMVFDFADGGAEDERTLKDNEAALAAVRFVPRLLRGCPEPDLAVELLGRRLALPVLIGPTGGAGLYWPEGEIASSRAAAAAGTVYVQSHGSTVSIEELARRGGSPRWYQAFLYRDRGLSRALIERAQAAGAEALVLTVDNQVLGQRERDLRNGLTIPPRVTARTALDLARHWPWALAWARGPRVTMANYAGAVPEASDIRSLGRYIAAILDPAIGWADLAWVRGLWRGPLLVKGILHADDARLALRHGADGLIVSNHGGRQLDGAVASARALPAVAAAVGGAVPVLLDGGVRRGGHVLAALALGASAVLIGRPQLWGLAVAGEAGVARVLAILKAELARAMALAGVAGVAEAGPELLAEPPSALTPAPARLRAAE
jgi:L-lactate dehydrogenase (cytochrome)/(S)-mandelate dehydrogenase